MNKTLFMAAVVSMAVACRRGEPYHNFAKWKTLPYFWDAPLKGHPREVFEREYQAADSARPDMKRFLSRRFHFDDDGNLVREDSYMSDKLVYWSVWVYDQDGVQDSTTSTDGKFSKLAERAIFVLNRQGDAVRRTVISDGYSSTEPTRW